MAKALMCLSGSTRLQLCRLGAFRRPLQLQTRPADARAKATATGKRIQKRTGGAACRGGRACAVGALHLFALRPRTPAPLISPLPLLLAPPSATWGSGALRTWSAPVACSAPAGVASRRRGRSRSRQPHRHLQAHRVFLPLHRGWTRRQPRHLALPRRATTPYQHTRFTPRGW